MNRLARLGSAVCFGVGSILLAVGIHRVVFGVHPKLAWVRDLPWDQVSAPACFAAALGLAAVGAWLGRRGLAPSPSAPGAHEGAIGRESPIAAALAPPPRDIPQQARSGARVAAPSNYRPPRRPSDQ